jgi:hypothetical protein
MTSSIRALVHLGLLSVSLVAFLCMIPMKEDCQGWDCRGLPDLLKVLLREQQRQAALECSLDAVNWRSAEKEKITHELLEGRLTLLEAQARFQSLNESRKDCPIEYHKLYAGATEEERTCREVISWAYAIRAITSRSEAAAVARRLEAELQHHFQAEGDRNGGFVTKGETKAPPHTETSAVCPSSDP